MNEELPLYIYFIGEGIMLLILSAAIIALWRNKATAALNKHRKLFILYLLLGLLQALISLTDEFVIQYAFGVDLSSVSANFFTIFEFAIFSYFFYMISVAEFQKKVIVAIFTIFLSGCLINWIFISKISQFPHILTVIESIVMIAFCLTYFFHRFNNMATETTKTNQYPVWIVSGMLVYFVCLVPLFLILEFVPNDKWPYFQNLAYINFLSSSFLYLTLIKTFQWKPMPKAL